MGSQRNGASLKASGQLLLRLPPRLHGLVQEAARISGLSVNEYCLRRLAAPGPRLGLEGPWADLLTRADHFFTAHLAGIIAHGSWARGTAGPASDIDALIVLDPTVPLIRDTYRAWDENPLSWGGRSVDAHFVHLPAASGSLSALWYEAAIEGTVIYERDAAVSGLLLRARQAIAAGRAVRRVVQGQPYWTGAA